MSDRGSESENPAIPSPTAKPARPRTNQDWWPNQLNLQVLHQHSPRSNPMDGDFTYAEEFKTLDLDALKRNEVEGLELFCVVEVLAHRIGQGRVLVENREV